MPRYSGPYDSATDVTVRGPGLTESFSGFVTTYSPGPNNIASKSMSSVLGPMNIGIQSGEFQTKNINYCSC